MRTGDAHHAERARGFEARSARIGDACSRRRSGFDGGSSRRTGGALYGLASHGWAASFRRPGEPDTRSLGSIARAAAPIRARASRWRRSVRPPSRRIPCSADHASTSHVAPNGYAWWYIDAFSERPPQYGLTIIAFIGSVFSPYYKLSGRGRPRESLRDQRLADRPARVRRMGDDGTWSVARVRRERRSISRSARVLGELGRRYAG